MSRKSKNIQVVAQNETFVASTEVVAELGLVDHKPTKEQLEARRNELLAELGLVEGQLSQYRNHNLDTSVVTSPCKLVREAFVRLHPLGVTRGEFIKKMVARGIARNTVNTQYELNRQRWLKGDPKLLELAEQLVGTEVE
jgi:hypothetical protein